MSRAARLLLAPLHRAATLRRAAHLLAGGILAVALGLPLLAAIEAPPLALLSPLLLVLAGSAPTVRTLERAQADALLGTHVSPDVPALARPGLAVRPEVVAWLALRAALGAVGSLLLLGGAAAAAASLVAPFAPGFFDWPGWRSPGGVAAAWLPLAGGLVLLAALHAADVLGAVQARAAGRLLGPGQDEELATLRARAGVLAERERIARELHDGVGHAVTVTLLQAQAADRVLDRDPAAAREALSAIRSVSRTTMHELDRVLGLLRREDDGDAAGDRGPADFAALAEGLRAAGLPFTLELPADLDRLAPAVRVAAYRIVQEGATNVLRHAGPVDTRARLAARGDVLAITIANAAGPGGPGLPDGGGRGLDGVRERARVLGGEATAAPSADGGWEIRASLPLGGVP